ncbi:hypothetical protein [Thermosulfurimonas sp. F29]|uniref:hypothetical protein n=1 Tax=Thermosulfurimonas sp. F29 TaxID=2867247 RepID=UPI001C836F6E|nr:hypothetical protein [Thermosulfurimonas sp. F29]MBX6423413.1 hypothetical protein [Thermosulfurimonas sp. F29]
MKAGKRIGLVLVLSWVLAMMGWRAVQASWFYIYAPDAKVDAETIYPGCKWYLVEHYENGTEKVRPLYNPCQISAVVGADGVKRESYQGLSSSAHGSLGASASMAFPLTSARRVRDYFLGRFYQEALRLYLSDLRYPRNTRLAAGVCDGSFASHCRTKRFVHWRDIYGWHYCACILGYQVSPRIETTPEVPEKIDRNYVPVPDDLWQKVAKQGKVFVLKRRLGDASFSEKDVIGWIDWNDEWSNGHWVVPSSIKARYYGASTSRDSASIDFASLPLPIVQAVIKNRSEVEQCFYWRTEAGDAVKVFCLDEKGNLKQEDPVAVRVEVTKIMASDQRIFRLIDARGVVLAEIDESLRQEMLKPDSKRSKQAKDRLRMLRYAWNLLPLYRQGDSDHMIGWWNNGRIDSLVLRGENGTLIAANDNRRVSLYIGPALEKTNWPQKVFVKHSEIWSNRRYRGRKLEIFDLSDKKLGEVLANFHSYRNKQWAVIVTYDRRGQVVGRIQSAPFFYSRVDFERNKRASKLWWHYRFSDLYSHSGTLFCTKSTEKKHSLDCIMASKTTVAKVADNWRREIQAVLRSRYTDEEKKRRVRRLAYMGWKQVEELLTEGNIGNPQDLEESRSWLLRLRTLADNGTDPAKIVHWDKDLKRFIWADSESVWREAMDHGSKELRAWLKRKQALILPPLRVALSLSAERVTVGQTIQATLIVDAPAGVNRCWLQVAEKGTGQAEDDVLIKREVQPNSVLKVRFNREGRYRIVGVCEDNYIQAVEEEDNGSQRFRQARAEVAVKVDRGIKVTREFLTGYHGFRGGGSGFEGSKGGNNSGRADSSKGDENVPKTTSVNQEQRFAERFRSKLQSNLRMAKLHVVAVCHALGGVWVGDAETGRCKMLTITEAAKNSDNDTLVVY